MSYSMVCGFFFQFGYVLERNFTRAFEIFTDLAADGSPAGQQVKQSIGVCLYTPQIQWYYV